MTTPYRSPVPRTDTRDLEQELERVQAAIAERERAVRDRMSTVGNGANTQDVVVLMMLYAARSEIRLALMDKQFEEVGRIIRLWSSP